MVVEKIIMHLLFKKFKKHILWMDFQSKYLNFEMVLNFIYVYWYHSPQKKIQPRIQPLILVLKYKCKIFYFVMNVIWSQIYNIHSIFSIFVWFFKELTSLTLRLIKTNKQKSFKMCYWYIFKKKLQ